VTRHGEDAPVAAAMRADTMLEKGDPDGYAVWRRILLAVETTQGISEVGSFLAYDKAALGRLAIDSNAFKITCGNFGGAVRSFFTVGIFLPIVAFD
jgi:hypothetical protein